MEISKLKTQVEDFNKLVKKLSDPDIIKNQNEFKKYSLEYSRKKPVIGNILKLLNIEEQIIENTDIVNNSNDSELKEMANEELKEIDIEKSKLEEMIKVQMLPEDPDDNKNILIEIRAGTGGEEAALFVSNLFRMYKKYAEDNSYKTEIMNFHQTGLGGYREIIFGITGDKPYKKFKYESGTHRVQRVPATESNGRIHTSAVTVAVLPEVENVDNELSEKDLKIDIFHASGAGGQNVNNVATAVRMTHIPSGVTVVCQDERSQYKNKEKAKRILKARIYDKQVKDRKDMISKNRKDQIGSGDRSQRIRTYNFPENRVADHRINLTIYRLEEVMNGNLDLLMEPLQKEDVKERLEKVFG